MTDTNTTQEVLEEARREERRQNLVEGYRALEGAKKEHEAKREKARKALAAEKARQKREKAKIDALNKEAARAHNLVRQANECAVQLMDEYVDRDLIRARDKAAAAASRAGRELDAARRATNEQRRVIERKSQRMVEGVLRDSRGRPLREKPDPEKPLVQPKAKRGPVRNPRFWKDDAEKAHHEGVLRGLELKETEAQARAEKAQKVYIEAQNKLDDAVEHAFRG